MINNFMGKNGFVWWVGIVENRNDPLKLGSLRVRIIGWHSESLADMPSEKLPWAPVTMPVTHSRASVDVKEGEMVFGFFMDGMAGQYPVVMGVFPGIKSVDDNVRTGFSPQLTEEQKKELPVAPKDVVLGASQKNEPTIPRTARGKLDGTLIEQTNKDVVHVCDIVTQMRRNAAWERLKKGQFVTWIREQLNALITALGLSPDTVSQRIIELAKQIRRYLKRIQDLIEELNDYLQITVEIARLLRAIIDWIQSLPARIKATLSNCLAAFLAGIGSLVSDLLTLPGSGSDLGAAFDEVKKTVEQIESTAKSTQNLLTVPQQLVSAITTPASISSIDEINSSVISYITEAASIANQTNQNAVNSITASPSEQIALA